MGRFARLRPVKSEKEEISWSELGTDMSTTRTQTIAIAVDSPTTAGQVEIGDTIRSVFFEFNLVADDSTTVKVFHWQLVKSPHGDYAEIGNSYDTDHKNQILKRGMEMLPKATTSVQIKRIFVVRIPPRLRRMADGDLIQLRYQATSAETINFCGIAIYKHFS